MFIISISRLMVILLRKWNIAPEFAPMQLSNCLTYGGCAGRQDRISAFSYSSRCECEKENQDLLVRNGQRCCLHPAWGEVYTGRIDGLRF